MQIGEFLSRDQDLSKAVPKSHKSDLKPLWFDLRHLWVPSGGWVKIHSLFIP